ncbi:hypothetical protein EV363DRAFT_1167625, partial [Boletus edulis]
LALIGATCAMFLQAARRDGEWVQPCRMAVFFTAFPAQLILICSALHHAEPTIRLQRAFWSHLNQWRNSCCLP